MVKPLSLEDARRQIRLELADESRDADLNNWIDDAVGFVETCTGLILEARDVVKQFRGCAFAVLDDVWPIEADAVPTIKFNDADGQPIQLVARLDTVERPARVLPLLGTTWPFTSADQRFTVTVRAGYEAAAAVPRNLKRAMLMMISAYDEDREGGDLYRLSEETARGLCDPFRKIEI